MNLLELTVHPIQLPGSSMADRLGSKYGVTITVKGTQDEGRNMWLEVVLKNPAPEQIDHLESELASAGWNFAAKIADNLMIFV